MFSENNYISGKISIFNQKEISQIKINLDRYPKTFLVTEFREGNQKKLIVTLMNLMKKVLSKV